jgi:rod shape-determining protein MreC
LKIRTLVLPVAIGAVCLLLLTVQTRGQRPGTADALALVTTPVQLAAAKIHRGAFGLWSTYLDWKNVRAENHRLREEIQRLRVDALRVSETSEENARLRRLLVLREQLPMSTLPGEVIAREWGGWIRSLTVNRGKGDHVARLTAVISPDGLVGRVVDVRPGASIVQVLSDPASSLSAHVVRTRTVGLVEGEPSGSIRLKFMARDGAGIQVGDLVVTSGLGGLFPRGIPIGRVRAIDNRGSALFHYANLTPVVDLSRIDEVLLVTGNTTHDIAANFPSEG